jgi:ABC-type molybdenum transport system ATPase subunit/photorepair protein PhrA
MEALSKLSTWVHPKKETKVLLLGLPGSGKTTLLYHWKEGVAIKADPTLGFNVEKIQHKRWQFNVRDMASEYSLCSLQEIISFNFPILTPSQAGTRYSVTHPII